MKRPVKLVCLLLLTVLMNLSQAYASHISGGEITWKCIGQDSFLVSLDIYRDCNGVTLTASPIIFKCATTGIQLASLTIPVGSPVDITPVCPVHSCTRCQSTSCSFPYGIQRYVMQGLVVLSSAGTCCDILISCQQGSRGSGITTGAANLNAYFEARLNRCLNPCDNSPSFSNPPITILCIGQDLTYNLGATDIDTSASGDNLDSFSYEWCNPLKDSVNPTPYIGSYTFNKPIYFWGFPTDTTAAPRGLHLDSLTGTMQFRPMKIEGTVMAVKVNEFRDGVKIGEIRRDMMVIVISCPNNNPPTLSGPLYKEVCATNTVTFTINTNDYDAQDTLTISWNGAISGASWTDNNTQVKHPTGTFSWTPGEQDSSWIPYEFSVTVKDNALCPQGVTTQVYRILVKHATVNLGPDIYICSNGSAQLNATYSDSVNSNMWFGPNSFSASNLNTITVHDSGRYVNVVDINGCSYSDTVYVYKNTDVIAYVSGQTICYGDTAILQANPTGSMKSSMQWLWYIDTILVHTGIGSDSATRTFKTNPAITTDYKLVVIDTNNGTECRDSITVRVRVNPLPDVQIDSLISLCNNMGWVDLNQFLTIDGVFKGGGIWTGGAAGNFFITTYALGDYQVNHSYKDQNGCIGEDSAKVRVYKSPIVYLGSDTILCSGSNIILNAGNGVEAYYKWSTGSTDSIITVNESGTYFVEVSSSGTCFAYDTINIQYYSPIQITLNPLHSGCKSATGSVTSSVSGGKAPYRYFWSNGDTTSGITKLKAGTYVLTVLDGNGCSSFAATNINDSAGPVISINKILPVKCHGGTNGSIDITVTGGKKPYSYEWSNGKSVEDISGLSYGQYEVAVSDSNECNVLQSIIVPEPDMMEVNAVVKSASCSVNDGEIMLTVSGGTKPYQYLWNTANTTNNPKSLKSGLYSVTITDSNGCSMIRDYTVNDSGGPVVIIDSVVHTNCNKLTGGIYIKVLGPENKLKYLWSTGYAGKHLKNVPVGTYSLTVTDTVTGCKTLIYATIRSYKFLPQQEICLVTTDNKSGKNMIVWERKQSNEIAYYNIYKETTLKGIYTKIGSVLYDSLSIFIDYNSNPRVKSDRYCITAVDMCGNESEKSTSHKTVHLCANKGTSGENNLIWSHYEGAEFLTYHIYRGTSLSNIILLDSVSSDISSYSDLNPPLGLAIYQVVTIFPKGCDPEAFRSQTEGIPFSQSFSNIKEYSQQLTGYLMASPTEYTLNPDSGDFVYLDVFTNANEWDASKNASWLQIQKSFVNNYIKVISGSPNFLSDRKDSIRIAAPGINPFYVIVIQEGQTGLEEFEDQVNILIFPNPSGSHFALKFGLKEAGNSLITIFDLAGKVVKTVQMNASIGDNTQIIDLNELVRGFYFVEISVNGQRIGIEKLSVIK